MADTGADAILEQAVMQLEVPSDIVQPPRGLKTIIEKAASYFVRNGKQFEERLRKSKADDPKFSWLQPDDVYHDYFRWRNDKVAKNGGIDAAGVKAKGNAATAVAQQQRGPSKPEMVKPPDYQFSAKMPNISAQDLDVVKLTALFVARNGRQFITSLSQKEAGNWQFDFLRPQHTLNGFFQRLIEQYELLIKPEAEYQRKTDERKKELEKNISNKYHILDRAKQRAKWIQQQESRRAAKEEKEAQDRVAYAEIDWHDFTVVETIVFNEDDEKEELPAPTSLNDLQAASLEEKGRMTESLVSGSRRLGEAFPGEFETTNGTHIPAQVPSFPQQQPRYQPPPPPQPGMPYPPPPHQSPYPQPPFPVPGALPQRPPSGAPPPFSPVPPPSASPNTAQPFTPPPPLETNRLNSPSNAQQPSRAPAPPTNIRTDYQPRARARQKEQTAQCPTCQQQIPLSQYNEHVRIEQLDPRWRDQRAKEASRNATTNLSTSDVANNLKRLASQRGDLFDASTGEVISEEEKERRKRAALSYDGVIPGLVRPGPTGKGEKVDLEEQLKRIKEKAQGH